MQHFCGNHRSHYKEDSVHKNSFTACVFEDYLYVFNEKREASRVLVQNKRSGYSSRWEKVTDMLHAHGELQCVVHADRIYVGGNNLLESFRDKRRPWNDVHLNGYCCNYSALVGFRKGFSSLSPEEMSNGMMSAWVDEKITHSPSGQLRQIGPPKHSELSCLSLVGSVNVPVPVF